MEVLDNFSSPSLPGLTRQSIKRTDPFAIDARAFAAPKGLRPRRRVKPAHDAVEDSSTTWAIH
jgi:hypothetical protein